MVGFGDKGDKGDKSAKNEILSAYRQAQNFIKVRNGDNKPHLRHWRGVFYERQPHGASVETSADMMRKAAYEFLDKYGAGVWSPWPTYVNNLVDALKAVTQLNDGVEAPLWISGEREEAARDLLVCRNGLLHLPTGRMLPHDPDLFSLNGLTYDYNESAPAPVRWLRFLRELWGDDETTIGTLQEMFGLFLTPDTRFQKAFLLVGTARGGKGTIARVLQHMVGLENCCGPTLSSLAQIPFGIESMIGKRVAVISDARVSKKTDPAVVAERLLTITGEDTLSIVRKNKSDWIGKLSVRVVIVTNEMPHFSDMSGALPSRFVVLRFTRSFLGREDPDLTNKLLTELPGILNWALAGLARLRARGRFEQPTSAEAEIAELEDLASPVSVFLRECCLLPRGDFASGDFASSPPPESLSVPCKWLYGAWANWCRETGQHPGSDAEFGKNLKAARPEITKTQLREKGGRVWLYRGIALAPPPTAEENRQNLLDRPMSTVIDFGERRDVRSAVPRPAGE